MIKLKSLFPLFFAAILLAACSSPNACFVIDKADNSIRVGEPVVFDATCSSKGSEYVWQFNGRGDSTIYYNQVLTKTFADTGNFTVELVVLKNNKTGSAIKTYYVSP